MYFENCSEIWNLKSWDIKIRVASSVNVWDKNILIMTCWISSLKLGTNTKTIYAVQQLENGSISTSKQYLKLLCVVVIKWIVSSLVRKSRCHCIGTTGDETNHICTCNGPSGPWPNFFLQLAAIFVWSGLYINCREYRVDFFPKMEKIFIYIQILQKIILSNILNTKLIINKYNF